LGLTDLNRVMEYKTFNFGVYKNPVWQSLQHLANHGTYHRGQITTLLRQLGAKPCSLTSCTFIASAPPPPPHDPTSLRHGPQRLVMANYSRSKMFNTGDMS